MQRYAFYVFLKNLIPVQRMLNIYLYTKYEMIGVITNNVSVFEWIFILVTAGLLFYSIQLL